MSKKKSFLRAFVREQNAGLLFVASMFVGIGIGYFYGRTGAGTLIGMGVGFMLMYMAKRE